jgi:hypothetical protein
MQGESARVLASSTFLDAVARARAQTRSCPGKISCEANYCIGWLDPSMAKLRREVGVAKAGVKCWGSTVLAAVERWNICRLISFRWRQGRGGATMSNDRQ